MAKSLEIVQESYNLETNTQVSELVITGHASSVDILEITRTLQVAPSEPSLELVADPFIQNVYGDSGVWGSINGTLSDQTDLQTELDTLQTQVDNKLDDTYAHFKKVSGPPTVVPAEGEVIYYTTAHLEGSVKVTEHKLRDSLGNDTLIKTFKEVL